MPVFVFGMVFSTTAKKSDRAIARTFHVATFPVDNVLARRAMGAVTRPTCMQSAHMRVPSGHPDVGGSTHHAFQTMAALCEIGTGSSDDARI